MKECIIVLLAIGAFIFIGVMFGAGIRDGNYNGLLDKELYEIRKEKAACELNIPRTQVCKPTTIWTPTERDVK